MAQPAHNGRQRPCRWRNPVAGREYERRPTLAPGDRAAIESWLAKRAPGNGSRMAFRSREREALLWLFKPLEDVLDYWDSPVVVRSQVIMLFTAECLKSGRTFWDWNRGRWMGFFGRTAREFFERHNSRIEKCLRVDLAAAVFMHGWFKEFQALGTTQRRPLANRVFGADLAGASVSQVTGRLAQWGYALDRHSINRVVCDALLRNESPYLEDLAIGRLRGFRDAQDTVMTRRHYFTLSRVLADFGILDRTLERGPHTVKRPDPAAGAAPEWREWVDRWTATTAIQSKDANRMVLRKAGRWLAAHHPEIVSPEQWTRTTAAELVAAAVRMRVGEYNLRTAKRRADRRRLKPSSAAAMIGVVRSFFRDCQEWGWIEKRFDPARSIAAPRDTLAQIGPKPRVIADDRWARLLWAGLNLNLGDIPRSGCRPGIQARIFPLEYIRAAAAVWLFAALRRNEIRRLRARCIRWQPAAAEGGRPVCLLDVPENKTGAPYSKPVDPAVGQAVEAWLAVRPGQPPWPDPKTGELIDPLFMYRALPMSAAFINATLIPLLCRKAGIPDRDAGGRISSHRARATIANQLFNSREPMSLSELQAWLGHRSPHSTQHYVTITPTKLARAYTDAGYFARNTRIVKVLIGRDRFTDPSGSEKPWLHYDLGHGWCGFEFFDRCPHRMACARCDFYIPKDSTAAQLLEANENNHRFLKAIPVTDEERAAAEGDRAAIERLFSRLEHEPTPSGQTPAQLRQHGRADTGDGGGP